MLRTLLRYWHTLRWLRPVQFYGRLWFRLHKPKPDGRPAPEPRRSRGSWKACRRRGSMAGPCRFRFLGVEREIALASDWNHADWPKLWLYNAHYFDDLAAEGSEHRSQWHKELIERWIAENPAGSGNGWEPYPVSLRIVNWVKWGLAGNILSRQARDSLAMQARWLCRRLEIHLLGNHLWANAKALVFAGSFFDGQEADSWRRKGLSLLRAELSEQILRDGGHFERSPMYHAILLEDVLDLVQLSYRYPDILEAATVKAWASAAKDMLGWLQLMSHPDGDIALFNDAALDVAANPASLIEYAELLGVPAGAVSLNGATMLDPSGFVRLQAGKAALLADVGPVGPDYLPGHAHADTLSFEMSLGGSRLLVNGGISTYEVGPERVRQRGTAAHNTVTVDGQDSSEVWSGFRVARRARPFDVVLTEEESHFSLAAAHDGYRRLPGDVIHRRFWQLYAEDLVVEDRVSGQHISAVARARIAPGWLARSEGQSVSISSPDINVTVEVTGADRVILAPALWHPRFGQSVACQVIEMHFSKGRLVQRWRWGGEFAGAPGQAIYQSSS